MAARFRPLDHQPPLPQDRLLLKEPPSDEAEPMDVLFVGAGPAGLAGAIHLARLIEKHRESGGSIDDVEIGVLEKADALGSHTLSGAVVNPGPFRTLFPELADGDFPFRGTVEKEAVYKLSATGSMRIPTPPTMKNHGNRLASLGEVVAWMGEKAEELGINVFTGFPAGSLLIEDQRVLGVRTVPPGLDRDGGEGPNYQPPTDLVAKVVALAEGTRGSLTQAWLQWQGVRSENPQIYALGVKELWETKKPLDTVIHTMGWPLPNDAFGGSFLYPIESNLLALGLVVGLDYRATNFDVHEALQRMKLHPLFKPYFENGELLEWGAKTIPEGGYYALPDRRSGDGLLVLGDAAGFVDVPSLKGIHYSVQSGIFAAQSIFEALLADDFSANKLKSYDQLVDESFIRSDLHRTRNMRSAFKSGFWAGGIKAGLMTLTGGKFPGGRIAVEEDAAEERDVVAAEPFTPDGELTFSKVDAVFKAGNETRDDVPSHLVAKDDVPEEVAQFYASLCPAGVYEVVDGKLQINAPNCVDCKATDVVGPRWTPREGGSGPQYKRM